MNTLIQIYKRTRIYLRDQKRLLDLQNKHNGCTVNPTAQIDRASTLNDFTTLAEGASLRDSHIGSHSSIGRRTTVWYVDMGRYCSVSWNVAIGAKNHHADRLTTHAFPYLNRFGIVDTNNHDTVVRTIVGHDVWIGANAIIMPGITIGNGAIIGAGAIVTKDVEPYSIVVGCPAKHMRYRFDKNAIETLQSVAWWDWPTDLLKSKIHLFQENMTEDILKEIESTSSELKKDS